eukprot:g15594.t1
MFVPITWLNCRGPLLNTKWDESLPITESFVDLVGEALGFESRMPRGAILVFVAHPMVWMGGQRTLGSRNKGAKRSERCKRTGVSLAVW